MPKYKGIVNLTLICVDLLFYIIWNSSAFLCGVRVPADTLLPRVLHKKAPLCLILVYGYPRRLGWFELPALR